MGFDPLYWVFSTDSFSTYDYVVISLLALLAIVKYVVWVLSTGKSMSSGKSKESAGPKLESLHYSYLVVFWLIRAADWVQGPYFYEVYASKVVDGELLSSTTVSALFLVGFVSSAICGTFVGSLVDTYGRKLGCVAFCIIYALSALSTKSSLMSVLVGGRILGGIATSLLYSAPEAWFLAQHSKVYGNTERAGSLIGNCFGWAWFGDGIVAIISGQLASAVVSWDENDDPTSAFMLSIVMLALALACIVALWAENYGAQSSAASTGTLTQVSDTISKVRANPNVILVGTVQFLYEGAMFVFVLAWPPSVITLMGADGPVPFGKIFSSFMVCCMIGSSFFPLLLKNFNVEQFMVAVLAGAAASLGLAFVGLNQNSTVLLLSGFFVFEATVGLYFPSIGMLRSKYIPNDYKTTAMNIFRIPLNLIVVSINLSVATIGTTGALLCSASLIVGAALAQSKLSSLEKAGRGKKAVKKE